jgi:hypothetical protein
MFRISLEFSVNVQNVIQLGTIYGQLKLSLQSQEILNRPVFMVEILKKS